MFTRLFIFCVGMSAILVYPALVTGQQLASEQGVSEADLAVVEELLTNFKLNYDEIEKYSLAVFADIVKGSEKEDPLFTDRWHLVCKDDDSKSVRIDEISRIFDQNGLPTMLLKTLIIVKERDVHCFANGELASQVVIVDEDPGKEWFHKLPLFRFDPWELALGAPLLERYNARWRPQTWQIMQSREVMSFSKNKNSYQVRFLWSEKDNVAIDVVFDQNSKMPIRADTVFLNQGIKKSTVTSWDKAKFDDSTWVPKEITINSVLGPIRKPTVKLETRLSYFWYPKSKILDNVFKTEANAFISRTIVKDWILDQAMENDNRKQQ